MPRFGMMNNPMRKPAAEIRWAARHGFDYIEFTVEPPRAGRTALRSPAVREALETSGLDVVGHLGWYYPLDLPTQEARRGIRDSLLQDLAVLAELGARKATVHLFLQTPRSMVGTEGRIRAAAGLLTELVDRAVPLGIRPMLEHLTAHPEHLRSLAGVLKKVPDLGLVLDVGHANLGTEGNAAPKMIERWADRLAHVHVSDNQGRDDQHLPIGAGLVDWRTVVRSLRQSGYEGTITLEVFSRDREYLKISLAKLRRMWEQGDREPVNG